MTIWMYMYLLGYTSDPDSATVYGMGIEEIYFSVRKYDMSSFFKFVLYCLFQFHWTCIRSTGWGINFRAFQWYNICNVLQFDQCRYFMTIFYNTLKCTTINKPPVDPIHVQVIYTCSYTYLVHVKNLIHMNSYLAVWIRRWFQKQRALLGNGSNLTFDKNFSFCSLCLLRVPRKRMQIGSIMISIQRVICA